MLNSRICPILTVGIDIGRFGCIGAAENQRVVRCIPITNEFASIAAGIRTLQETGLSALSRIVIETPAAIRGKWNRQDLVNRAFGYTVGLLVGSGFVNVRSVHPNSWTAAYGLWRKPKEAHIDLANEIYPNAKAIIAEIGDGAADALLIASYAGSNWEDLERKPLPKKRKRRRRKK